MSTAVSGFRQIATDLPGALDRVARQPDVKRPTQRYLDAIADVKSIDDFLRSEGVYNFALKAFGLDDMAYAKAFIRRILSEGIDRRDSLANRLADRRYRAFVETFNFARYGATTTLFDRARQGIVDRYVRQMLEDQAGNSNEGTRLALYFQRNAASIRSSYVLLGDRALLRVAQVALSIPASIGALDIDRQARIIEKKLDVVELADPDKLDKLLKRFVALWDVEHPPTDIPAQAGLAGANSTAAIDAGTLGRLQLLKKGPLR